MDEGKVSIATGEGQMSWTLEINGKEIRTRNVKWLTERATDVYVLQFEVRIEDLYGT